MPPWSTSGNSGRRERTPPRTALERGSSTAARAEASSRDPLQWQLCARFIVSFACRPSPRLGAVCAFRRPSRRSLATSSPTNYFSSFPAPHTATPHLSHLDAEVRRMHSIGHALLHLELAPPDERVEGVSPASPAQCRGISVRPSHCLRKPFLLRDCDAVLCALIAASLLLSTWTENSSKTHPVMQKPSVLKMSPLPEATPQHTHLQGMTHQRGWLHIHIRIGPQHNSPLVLRGPEQPSLAPEVSWLSFCLWPAQPWPWPRPPLSAVGASPHAAAA